MDVIDDITRQIDPYMPLTWSPRNAVMWGDLDHVVMPPPPQIAAPDLFDLRYGGMGTLCTIQDHPCDHERGDHQQPCHPKSYGCGREHRGASIEHLTSFSSFQLFRGEWGTRGT